MKLNVVRHGAPTAAPALVIAHGLFGSAKNWGAVARLLSVGREVVAVDMRNHGDSFRHPDHRYPALAADLARVVEDEGAPADVLGHSMGGKAAMVLALTRPELVRRLIVADIAPVAYAHDQMQYVEAMRALDLSGVTRRSQVEPQLAARVPERAVRAFLLQSLEAGPEGARWKLALDTLGARMEDILGFPPMEGRRFDGPTLFLAGEKSGYVRPESWEATMRLFPAARRVTLPDVGHWMHAEAPQVFAETCAAFLA